MRKIVLLPVFNEGRTLPAVLERLVLSSDAIIAIDDGSRDNSAEILRRWVDKSGKVTVISSNTNLGKSQALELGFRRVLKMLDRGLIDLDDAVITMDADGQIPPEIIDEACLYFVEQRLDMLIGSRDFRLYPRTKRLGNAFFTRLASFLAGFPFQDTLCGFRVLRAGSLARIMEWYRARRYFCEQEISMIGVMLGLKTANDLIVPTAYYRSNSTWSDAFQITFESLRTWWRLRKMPSAPSQAPGRPKNNRDAGRRSRPGLIRLIAGLALLAAAVYLRSRRPPAFANIITSQYSANNMLRDVADGWAIMKSVGGELFGRFAVENLLPAFIFLLPAVFLISGGLSKLVKSEKGVFAFLENRKPRTIALAVLFIVTLALSLAAHFTVVGHSPEMGDEFCYMFGADQLGSGKLYVESPPLKDHFQTWSIINDGRWYSKVTIGWPLLLAAGRPAHLEFLINPILAATCVVMLFLIGDLLFGVEAGLLAASWGLLTSFFIMMSGTYFPHTATALFSLLFIYFMLRGFETDKRSFPLLAGLSMVAVLMIRPADGGVLFLGMVPMMAAHWARSGEKKKAALKISVLVALFLVGIGLLMVINQVQNGHPLLFGYEKYQAGEKWGFGAHGHTLLKGLWNTAYSLLRVGSWGVPFVGLFLLVSLLAKKGTARLLAVPVLGYAALYAGFYTLALFEIGPRYYIPMYLLAIIPASGGAVLLQGSLIKRKAPGSRTFVAGLLVSTLVFVAVGVWPRLIASVKAQMAIVTAESKSVAEPPVESPSLIFLRDHLYQKNTFLNRNDWRYQNRKHVYALYLMPEDNKKVMEMFPDRYTYMTVVDPGTGKVDFVPYVNNSEIAENYLAAGLNYVEFDPSQAVRAFTKALALRPEEPSILINLARAYDMIEDRTKAVEFYARVVQSGQASLRDMALFFLATDLRRLGRTHEALRVFQDLARVGEDSFYRSRAQGWVEKLAR